MSPHPNEVEVVCDQLIQRLEDEERAKRAEGAAWLWKTVPWGLGFCVVAFVLAIVFGQLYRNSPQSVWLRVSAQLYVLIFQVSGIVTACLPALEPFRSPFTVILRSPAGLLKSSSEKAQADHELAAQLVRLEKVALEFVAKRLEREVDHGKVQTTLLAGAIDKLGLLPALAGICLAVWNFLKGEHALDIPYVVALPLTLSAYLIFWHLCTERILRLHRIEEMAQTVELALKMKEHEGPKEPI